MSDSGDLPVRRTRLLAIQAEEVLPRCVPVCNVRDFRCRVPGLWPSGRPKRAAVNLKGLVFGVVISVLSPIPRWLLALGPKTLIRGSDLDAAAVRWMRAANAPGSTTYTLLARDRIAVVVRAEWDMKVLWESGIERFIVVGNKRRARLWLYFPDGSYVSIPAGEEQLRLFEEFGPRLA
ncbi:hypothetical protein LWC34_43575 [Kibdelosporangium philippinense]|uniref:Uncharacterized protein n=1 Tax=Kibdelosporangium philippinense TaxID=211113 RepID=A0ABS8ZR12_9PSEU|nr:hypothetical protein [Kibdelosporangium philippinense]MCE7009643.1 hypothetical protein [Kibdelosporangium philippinense]